MTHQLRNLEEFLSKGLEDIPYHDEAHPEMISERFKKLVFVIYNLANIIVTNNRHFGNGVNPEFDFKIYIIGPVKSLFKLARCQFEISKRMKIATSERNNVRVPIDNLISDVVPDIVFEDPNRSVMFCKVTDPSFQQYKNLLLNYENLPLEMDENFKNLLLQTANNLINTGTDMTLMSDFESLVILGFNYKEEERCIEQRQQEQQENEQQPSSKIAENVTFQCQFIDRNTTGLTIHGVLLVYYTTS